MRRRTIFAAPFVVVGCATPPPAPRHNAHRARHEAPTPAPWKAPPEYFVDMPPVSSAQTMADACRTSASCNPPAPAPDAPKNWPRNPAPPTPVHHGPPEAGQWIVEAIARDGTGTKIRLTREDDRITQRWRINVVDADGKPLAPCALVGRDYRHVDCHTELAPQQVAPYGIVYGVLVEPP